MADSELPSSDIFGIDGDQDASGSGDKKRHLFLKDSTFIMLVNWIICLKFCNYKMLPSLTLLVRAMLYGFGDVENPLPETVAMVEEIAVQYILEMVDIFHHFIRVTGTTYAARIGTGHRML